MILLTLMTYLIHAMLCVQTCEQNQYVSEVDATTCKPCGTDATTRTQVICPSGMRLVEVGSNPCRSCCATCRQCDVCGLGIFLYHDFQGRACSLNHNVVCCEEENMDVYNDHCFHRTTTTTPKTTTVAVTQILFRNAFRYGTLRPDMFSVRSASGAGRTGCRHDYHVITASFFCGVLLTNTRLLCSMTSISALF
ncbi:hypothetical protein Btru_074244 [Bulinus truncatus]|nr:hypothetical protein Btru_074244 [Bulinus truncatus]